MSNRIESVMEHLTYTKGVVGVVLCTMDGVPIRDSFQNLDRSMALRYTEMASSLARQASLLFSPSTEDLSPRPDIEKNSREGAEEEGKKSSKKKDEPLPRGGDALELLRVRTRMNEIIVKSSDEFLIIVVQESGE